jgi:integrase
VVIALTLAKQGLHAESVACLLSFDCLLRVGELLQLRVRDVVQPLDSRLGSAHTRMALRLAHTKTGNNQWVSLHNPQVEQVLQHYLASSVFAVDSRVFPMSAARFRRSLSRVCVELSVGSTAYVPHSFRHGGATRAHLLGDSIQQIMLRGRWRNLESARRYIQTGRALLTQLHSPPQWSLLGNSMQFYLLPALQHYFPLPVLPPEVPFPAAQQQQRRRRL